MERTGVLNNAYAADDKAFKVTPSLITMDCYSADDSQLEIAEKDNAKELNETSEDLLRY